MAKLPLIKLLQKYDSSLDKDKATALIICRNVYVNGELCTDSKRTFDSSAVVEIIYPKYVSRGGFKLEKALDSFTLPSLSGLVALDAGSSTGGFSDCLLQRGVSAVHCVDVGFNLLDFKIRSDVRTVVHEKCNIMNLSVSDFTPAPDFAVADLSFRSIKGAASHVLDLTSQRWMIALIKPQFEVPRWQENFFGVVEDETLMQETLVSVWENLDSEGVGIFDAVVSPIKGHKGNTEFLALLKDKGKGALDCSAFLSKCIG
ncbi:MAG: TlyA family RNA methyltransferase [Sphaerochaetaceae bacterium]|nr:TlyA family RNA methyltransferase [Sphaerochaetaceae bacterium]